MKQFEGWWFPDGEKKMLPVLALPMFEGRLTYQNRKYEAARAHVRKFRHALDIGAHVGLWSRTMIRHFEKITAFEPMPTHRECFLKNIPAEDLKRIELWPYALGETSGPAVMSNKLTNSGLAHVAATSDGPDGCLWQQIPVEVRTLDSFELPPPIDFVKLDAEGFELFICRGGEETIRRNRPVMIVEQKPKTGIRYGLERTAAIRLLVSWGARVVCPEISGDFVLAFPQ